MTWRPEGHGRWQQKEATRSPFSPPAGSAPSRQARRSRSWDRQQADYLSPPRHPGEAAAAAARPETPRRPAPPVPSGNDDQLDLRPKAGQPARPLPHSWKPTVARTVTVTPSATAAPCPSTVPSAAAPFSSAPSSSASAASAGPALPELQLLQGASAKERKALRGQLRSAAHRDHYRLHFRSDVEWPPPICNRAAVPWGESVTSAMCSCTELSQWISKYRADRAKVRQVEFFHDAAGALVRLKTPIHKCCYWRPGGPSSKERHYYSGMLHRVLAIKFMDAWRLVAELN